MSDTFSRESAIAAHESASGDTPPPADSWTVESRRPGQGPTGSKPGSCESCEDGGWQPTGSAPWLELPLPRPDGDVVSSTPAIEEGPAPAVLPHQDPANVGKVGLRFNGGKPPLELLPWDALEAVARVLEHGATKYARRNWELGMDPETLLGCEARHVSAELQGESTDRDSGLPHSAHAAANALMRLALDLRRGD